MAAGKLKALKGRNMTPSEMRAKGYTVLRDCERLKLYQHGVCVASVSRVGAVYGFDWHASDQWHLKSQDVVKLWNEQEE